MITFSSSLIFFSFFFFLKCELKRSHLREGAVKGFSVFRHTHHRLSILFLYGKKNAIYFPKQS